MCPRTALDAGEGAQTQAVKQAMPETKKSEGLFVWSSTNKVYSERERIQGQRVLITQGPGIKYREEMGWRKGQGPMGRGFWGGV